MKPELSIFSTCLILVGVLGLWLQLPLEVSLTAIGAVALDLWWKGGRS